MSSVNARRASGKHSIYAADVCIVLSTSWVRWRGYTHARDRLPAKQAQRCVGASFHNQMDVTAFLAMSHGQEILANVRRREPFEWVAIDDDDTDWPQGCFVQRTYDHSARGISEPEVCECLKSRLDAVFAGQGLTSNIGNQCTPQGGWI